MMMENYNNEFSLSDKNYIDLEYGKTQIVIGNTLSNNMKHIERWKTRLNGESKKTTPFTISTDGIIYQHFDPKYLSEFIDIGHLDRRSIGISLENEGHLWFDEKKNCYVNWIGDIYNRRGKIVDVKWRDREKWAPYTVKQINSLVGLCKNLCIEFNIPNICVESNTVIPMVQDFEGIVFRSNFSKYFFDVSPAFNVKSFKNKIEKK